ILAASGVHAGWFICALVGWFLVAVLGVLWVDLSGRVLAVLLTVEIAIVLVYDFLMVAHPFQGHISFATLAPTQLLTPEVAAMLAFHTAVTRYQFALGRERVLPRLWGVAHPRTGAPLVGSITQSVLALGVLALYYITHTDPLVHLFAWMTVVGGLGVLILMWATSAAVIGFFVRHRRRENVWRAQIAP